MRFGIWIAALTVASGVLFAQAVSAQALTQEEQNSLQKALSEAGNSATELELAIENHLKQYPNSPKRADLESALVKTAISLDDEPRLVQYGESVLSRDPDNVQLLEHLTTALLHLGDRASAERALDHAGHLLNLIDATYQNDKFGPGSGPKEVTRKENYDRGRARAMVLEARADGLLGRTNDAIERAESSYKIYPSVEGAQEAARWLTSAGKDQDALQYLVDAFTIAGFRAPEVDSASQRTQIGELYRKLHGSEAGLGDMLLKTYDATSSVFAARRTEFREYDPNSDVKDPMHFTLSGLEGDKLQLSSLIGKVVVMDFWATWCGPCRAQHPLYEQVQGKFKDSGDVAFLAVDADEDHSLVKPFLTQMKWTQKVYFDGGLQRLLRVSSIPTTIIIGKNGEVFTRMVGYLPERFVDMLTDRVNEALGKPLPPVSDPPAPAGVHPATH